MKLSEIQKESDRMTEITALRDARREVSDLIKECAENGVVGVTNDYQTVEVSGEGVKNIIVGLKQQIADIELELTGMGVEIDEPADFVEPDEDAGEEAKAA